MYIYIQYTVPRNAGVSLECCGKVGSVDEKRHARLGEVRWGGGECSSVEAWGLKTSGLITSGLITSGLKTIPREDCRGGC